jgi:hypothetical protein
MGEEGRGDEFGRREGEGEEGIEDEFSKSLPGTSVISYELLISDGRRREESLMESRERGSGERQNGKWEGEEMRGVERVLLERWRRGERTLFSLLINSVSKILSIHVYYVMKYDI